MHQSPRHIGAVAALCLLTTACGDSGNLAGGRPPPDGGGGGGGGTPAVPQNCLAQPVQNHSHDIRPVNLAKPVNRQVRTIMAPGQSGHFPQSSASCPTCAQPGQSPETYGPHIDDQRLPFWRGEFKPGEFMDISGVTPDVELLSGAVRIYRDPFGVPVVHGDSSADLWYGAGYALAQDRLFLIDAAVRQARGTSGEVLGAGEVDADVQTRTLTYTEAEYAAVEAALSAEAQLVLAAHRDGINAWIDEVNDPLNPDAELPQEMVALNYTPAHISNADILALGVLMTRFVASAGGDEMVNVKALRDLEALHGVETGRRIFNDMMWQDDKLAAVTIPDREYTNISTPVAMRPAVFQAAADFAAGLPLDLIDGPGTGAFVPPPAVAKVPEDFVWPVRPELLAQAIKRYGERPDHISASYKVTVSPDKTQNGSALLINGPQLGWSYPTLLVELEVHGGGYDARGSTVAGLPVVGIGYGERIAWGLTTGESKTIDSFIETLDENDPNQYLHDGQTKTMDCRMEQVDYRSTSNGVPNVSEPEPGVNSVTVEVCRTVHGPVVARSDDGTRARSVQYAMWMREVETVEAVLDWNRVDTFAEFEAAMARATWNENLSYVDNDGNIAYWHPGLHPWRHPSADQRLPLNGDGSQDHCGFLEVENRPHRYNPPRGYLTNWNNKPAHGWGDGTSGDASQEPGGSAGRNVNWEELMANAPTVDYDMLLAFDTTVGRVDPRWRALLDPMIRCDGGCSLSAKEQQLLDILKTWDTQHYNDAIDIEAAAGDPGSFDTAAATIFGELVQAIVDEITVDVIPPDFIARHERRGNHPYDAGTFHKLAAKLFDPGKSSIAVEHDWFNGRSNDSVMKAVFGVALARLESTYGAATDPSQYLRVHARSSVCALADPLVGPCLDMPHTDRGSWIHAVEFADSP